MLATSTLPQNCPIDGKNAVVYAPEGVEVCYRIWSAALEVRAQVGQGKISPLALELLIPHQPIHQSGVTDAVMAADQKGVQRAGIGIFHGGMLGQLAELPQGGRADPKEATHLPRPVCPPVGQALGPQQGLEQGFGLAPEVEGRVGTPDAGKTAGAPFRDAHRDDPLPR